MRALLEPWEEGRGAAGSRGLAVGSGHQHLDADDGDGPEQHVPTQHHRAQEREAVMGRHEARRFRPTIHNQGEFGGLSHCERPSLEPSSGGSN